MSFTRVFDRRFWSPGQSEGSSDGFDNALRLFQSCAKRVPAYKHFLEVHNINPATIVTREDFKQLPRTDKPTYVSQYSLAEMSWDGTLDAAKYVSTSSGSTGVPFFWPRGSVQDEATGRMFQRMFSDILNGETGNTLFVNSFALGTWIAGFEFYNAAKWVSDQGLKITTVTPGIDRNEAVHQIRKLSALYSRIVLAGYPPFIKDILDHGTESGIDWSSLDLRLMVAGEAVSIDWKNRILERIGKAGQYQCFVNIYGMAEAGVVAHDTPLAQLVREHTDLLPAGTVETHDGLPVTGVYQYYPNLRYFEAESGQALALTAESGLPLIRYDTRDTGGIIERSVVSDSVFKEVAASHNIDTSKWNLPFVYLNGRKDLSISLYALMIYVENIKYALESSPYSALLSGLFTMSVDHTDELDQHFMIHTELNGSEIPDGLTETLTKHILDKLCSVNSEYAKLLASVGDRARPHVILVPKGHISTVPGRKHKWVKRT